MVPALPGDLTVTVARSLEKVEEIREIWNNFDPIPFADIDYFISRLNLRREIVRPHVIILSRHGKPETLLAGIIENKHLECRVSYKVIFRPRVRSLTIIHGGILGNTSLVNSAALISEINYTLYRREADIAYFTDIPLDSHLCTFAKTIPGFLFRDHFPLKERYFRMTVPDSIDDFHNARKNKNYYHKIVRRLNRKYPDGVAIRYFSDMDEVKQFCKDAEKISRKTYQFARGIGYTCNREALHFLNVLAKNGLFSSYIMYIDNYPCAFQAGFIHNDTYFAISTGYDPEYANFRIGNILMLNMIQNMCQEARVLYIDFGRGYSFYKQDICDVISEASDFYIFQPTLKGVWLKTLRTLTDAPTRVGNRLLDLCKLRESWLRFNRRRFTPGSKKT